MITLRDKASLDQAAYDREYMPRIAVPDFASYHARAKAASEELLAQGGFERDLRYAEGARATLDFFRAERFGGGRQPRGSIIYFHGGYWRSRDKAEFAFLASTFGAHGFDVFIVNYDLCPASSLSTLVSQAGAAFQWIDVHRRTSGLSELPLVALGHSAGAHLIATALAQAAASGSSFDISAVWLLSGIYDLTPVLHASINAELGLDETDAHTLSPVSLPVWTVCRTFVMAGADETKSWIAQSALYAKHLIDAGATVEFRILPRRHHFSIMDDLFDSTSPLTSAIVKSTNDSLRCA